MENKELFDLERELFNVDKELEKQKGRRNLILIFFYSVIVGLIISHFFKTIEFETIITIIIISLILGVVLWIVPLSVFHLVTDLFTNINSLDVRKKHLTERINDIRLKH